MPPASASNCSPPAKAECAGGLRAIFTPGHSRGHLAYLWPQHGGVLMAGDIASNVMGLGYSIIYENFAEGQRTLAKMTPLDHSIYNSKQ